MNMKHLNKRRSLIQTVAKTAAVTGVSLSMIAGNYAAIPHVALADDAPRSAFSEYAELVQKFSNANLNAQDRSRLRNEIADAKKAYQESIKSPFRKYADAVQEYANTGKLASDQLAEVRKHVKETKQAWVADKNGQRNPAINNVPPAQDPADNHDGANNNGAAANNNGAAAKPGDTTPSNPSGGAAKPGDTTPSNPSAIQRYAQLLEKINSGKLTAEELKSAKAEANKLYKEIIQGSHNDKPENEDPKDTDKQPSDTNKDNSKQGGKQKGTPKTSDPFGISGILGSVAGLATLGAGFVARKRF